MLQWAALVIQPSHCYTSLNIKQQVILWVIWKYLTNAEQKIDDWVLNT